MKGLPKSLAKIKTKNHALFEAEVSHRAMHIILLTVSFTFSSRNAATGEIEQLSHNPTVHVYFEALQKGDALNLRVSQKNAPNWHAMFATSDLFTHLIAAAKEADPQAKYLVFEPDIDENYLINILDQAAQFWLVSETHNIEALPLSESFKSEFLDATETVMEEGDDDEEMENNPEPDIPAAFICTLDDFDENGMPLALG